MCVTDGHDMTLAVEVALNPNTTNKQQQLLFVCLSGKGFIQCLAHLPS